MQNRRTLPWWRAAAEGEDELMEKYLESGSLSDEEMVRGLEDVVYSGEFVPVFCAAGAHEIGAIALLNDIVDLLPSPLKAVPPRSGAEQ